jgi:Spy/CpxP family protein refolding chaperone
VRDIGFGPFTAALSPEDRAALGQAFREEAPDLRGMRRDMRAEMGQLVQALRSAPFDEAALRAAIAVQDARGRARLELGQRLLAERLVAMTPGEREAFANRLEQIMDRGRDRRHGGSGGGD